MLKSTTLAFLMLLGTPVFAQAVAPVLPANMVAGKGETKSNNVTSGTRSSLTLGINSNFGSNASISAQNGYVSNATSNLAITSGSFISSFGKSGIVEADIRNIRTEGVKAGNVTTDSYNISPESASTAQGQALVKGMASELEVKLDPKTSASAQASQQVITTGTLSAGTSSANAGHSMNSSMNVDISNTGFSQSFSQAF